MIEFMVIGLPRSGTTWASALFTTDTTLCVHDPLYTTHYLDWDAVFSKRYKTVGVSCTGIWRWPDWVNSHPAKKILLHRDLHEIESSMRSIGLPAQDLEQGQRLLDSIDGLHVEFTDLFDAVKCSRIWDHILNKPFDTDRHKLLVDIEMQPKFSGLTIGADVTKRLVDELTRAMYE